MRATLKQSLQILKNSGVVAIPTETVYGLAARLSDRLAIKKTFLLKGRPADNPLIAHIADFSDLKPLVKNIPSSFKKLKKFWPGPLTIVFQARLKAVTALARASLKTVAIRMPAHPLTRQLLRQTGPLVAPSANLSGRPSATTAHHVEEDFGSGFPVLDGGPCRAGVESTVILLDESGWSLLRRGAVTEESLAAVLGPAQQYQKGKKPISPGQKYRHYAPRCRLIPCFSKKDLAKTVLKKKARAVLGFDDTKSHIPLLSLGARGKAKANLKRLYAALRQLDQQGCKRAIVDMDFSKTGHGVTLAERLGKACLP